MKAVRLNEFGGLEKLKIEDVPEPTPRSHHVLIKVDSAGVNYADILRRGGNYPGPDLPSSMGLEAAGTVMEVGSDVSGITVGQKVMGMGPGSQAEYVAINSNLVFPYPTSLDPVEAGGMPIVFLTSYHILKTRGGLQSGDTVLVQAGAGIWWLANVDSRVDHNDYQIRMLDKDVTHNSKFVLEWPSGTYLQGELPSDTRQNLKIERLEKQMDKVISKIYNGDALH